MRSEWQTRREIVAVGRRLYERGLVAGTDGNISARLYGDRLLVTPAGGCLGELRPEQLIYIDPALESRLRHRRNSPPYLARRASAFGIRGAAPPPPRPTSELPMHQAAYALRPDIGAIVHAHPPLATAVTVAGLSLVQPVLPEVIISLGGIPTAEYATPSSEEGARAIQELIRKHDAIMLDRHGAITVGTDPLDAFRKLEKLEHYAHVTLAAHQMGGVRTLSPEQVAKLEAMRTPSPDP